MIPEKVSASLLRSLPMPNLGQFRNQIPQTNMEALIGSVKRAVAFVDPFLSFQVPLGQCAR